MTEERLSEIEKRAAAATKGPWRVDEERHHAQNQVVYCELYEEVLPAEGKRQLATIWKQGERSTKDARPDARFVAHSRTDIPDLIAEVRRLRAELDSAKKEIEGMKQESQS